MGQCPLIATMKLYLVLVPLLLSLSSCSAEGGLFGFGLLGGDDGGSGTGTESPLSPGILGQLESALTPPTEAPKPDVLGTVMAIMDIVSGKSSELPLEGIAALFGITATPIPSPVKEPLKFLMHPLILAGVTMNPAALALGMGNLAGNLALTHILNNKGLIGGSILASLSTFQAM